MASFPDTSEPHEFNLEHANAAGVDMFATVITTCTGDAADWRRLNRELPVRLFQLPAGPALHWWEYTPDTTRSRARSEQRVAVIPDWLWELLQGETNAAEIRDNGARFGIHYPAVSA